MLLASGYTPNRSTHTVYADLTDELSTANGYTSGGATVATPTTTRSGAVSTFDAADVPAWTASGGAIVARYCALYANVTRNTKVDPLIAYFLLDSTPADVTVADGDSLQVVWSASGIFAITVTPSPDATAASGSRASPGTSTARRSGSAPCACS